jgi:hypothetical protein
MSKYTILQGLDIAREYASAKALRELPLTTAIQVLLYKPRRGFVNCVYICGWQNPYTAKQFARLLQDPRLLAFTICTPETQDD